MNASLDRLASFERSPAALYNLDDRDVILAVSDSWLDLLGYRRDEVVGQPVARFREAGSEAAVAADRATLLSAGEVRDVERRFSRRDGSIVEALVSARLERRDGVIWVACALTDVTARKRAEAALRVSEARLHQARKMEAIGQLTGGIAHDFNNLLQGIGGALDIMQRRVSQGRAGEVVRYIEPVRQSVSRAAALTSRMLAFARRQVLQPRPIEPDDFIRAREATLRETVGSAVRLELRLHDGWLTFCDPGQLESALLNVALNAYDAMPDGGTLTIATADRRLTGGDASGDGDPGPRDYIEISVNDTGGGMAAEVRARAFEPFYTTKPIGRGTGLGLSQLYGFARQSGGFVRLESETGQGTTVRLYLPRHHSVRAAADWRPELERRATARPDDGEAAMAPTVLVIDDQPDVLAVVTETLRELGYRVLEGGDGPAGLKVLQSGERVDMLISDIGLPGLNGRQLAEAARTHRPGLPVLLMTGYAGAALDDLPPAPGMATLLKPFELDQLVTWVRTLLGQTVEPGAGVSLARAIP